jgi:hypothetical protein
MTTPNWIPDELDLSEYEQSSEMRQKIRARQRVPRRRVRVPVHRGKQSR